MHTFDSRCGMLRYSRLLPVTMAMALSATVAFAADPPVYDVTHLGPMQRVSAMNAHGVCVGATVEGSLVRAWVARPNGTREFLPLGSGGPYSRAFDINDSGVIIGMIGGENGRPIGWYPDGQGGYDVVDLGTLPGHQHGVPTAINNRGDIVGMSIIPGWMGGPAVWFNAPEGLRDLTPHGMWAKPEDISDQRIVVGGTYRFNMERGTVEEFGNPPGLSLGRFIEVNEFGQMAATAGNGQQHDSIQLVRWTDGHGWDLITDTGGRYDGVYGLNSRGEATCEVRGSQKIFTDELGLRDLEDLLAPEHREWQFFNDFGNDINESGQIVVMGYNTPLQLSGPVLLTPRGLRLVADPIIRGELLSMSAFGANQGDRVFFLYSPNNLGSGPCVSHFGGLCLDLLLPVIHVATATADTNGEASTQIPVPANAPLALVHMQAVARRGSNGSASVKSNTVTAPVLPR